MACVRCRTADNPLPRCPYCGAVRDGGEASQALGQLQFDTESPVGEAEKQLERRLLLIAPPVALAFAFLLIQLDTWRMLARTFLTMWIHELGHAVAAWFCGRFALPGPWVTRLGEGRSVIVILLLAAAIGLFGYRAWVTEKRGQLVAAIVLGVCQLALTFVPSSQSTDALITFSGDGGMMVLGCLLMLTFWSAPDSYVHKQWLRWGFLVIGAFALADATMSWLEAKADRETIPYGEIEGVGHSDPTKLVFDDGWTEPSMVRRYLMLAGLCVAIVAARYGWTAVRRTTD